MWDFVYLFWVYSNAFEELGIEDGDELAGGAPLVRDGESLSIDVSGLAMRLLNVTPMHHFMNSIDGNTMCSQQMSHGRATASEAHLHHGLIICVKEQGHFAHENNSPEIERGEPFGTKGKITCDDFSLRGTV